MKQIRILAFSLTGYRAGKRLAEKLEKQDFTVLLDVKSKYAADAFEGSIQDYAKLGFADSDAILFIGSCGIAVRAIAPFLKGKKQDPAVLVMDECERHVISLVSGHLGGANALTRLVSACTGAEAVITTATDLHQQFAVDVFAKEQGLRIVNMQAAKEVSAAILHGEKVGFYSDFPYEGELPKGIVLCTREGILVDSGEKAAIGIAVTIDRKCLPFSSTVVLIPRCVTLGIGCRKGKDAQEILTRYREVLEREQVYLEAVKQAASIDLKDKEDGIRSLCEAYQLPFQTYRAEELKAVKGEFTPSAFVSTVTGVDNVCERSAVLASNNGKLILRKSAGSGITLALAIENWRIRF